MSRTTFLAWRWATVVAANLPNLLLVGWLFFWVTRGDVPPAPNAFAWNVGIFAAFVSLHSFMATARWKQTFASVFPAAFERATYVIVAGASLLLLMALWRPMPRVLWCVDGIPGRLVDALFWLALVFEWWVGRHVDQPAFAGTRQLSAYARGEPPPRTELVIAGPFRHVRNPMYAGMLVLLWSASTLTTGRLLFAVLATLYFVIGARFEEERLEAAVGAPYALYRANVPAFLPRMTPWGGG